jgi:hypothetical protein
MKKLLQLFTITVLVFATSAYADPLRVSPSNPRYFADSSGNILYLTGSHTWENFMDLALNANDPPFDWTEYLNFLQSNNHNFFRLWTWENAKWATFTTAGVTLRPLPFDRPGPGIALDGEPKFDLTSFNQAYFDRLRQRVIDAGQRGMYVSVMLFNGWSVESKGDVGNPWRGHPFNKNNNINGINGDPNNDNNGNEVHTLQIRAVTTIQEAYVRKVIDTLNDLDNVLYEICNEGNPQSVQWQYHMIDYIKSYEAGKPNQHPVGMTVIYPSGKNSDLFSSHADWISPNSSGGYDTNPPASNGAKVIITDSDHLWGIGGDRYWAWESFTRGINILFMDEYDFDGANINNPAWVDLRRNLGYIRNLAQEIDLANMVPRGDLASSGYALASGDEFLVYLPSGGWVSVDLTKNPGPIYVEWFNPQTGKFTTGDTVSGGSVGRFNPPFRGDAVLHLLGTLYVGGTDAAGNWGSDSITVNHSPSGEPSFPTTPVLDDFNRSNTGPPPSASWTTIQHGHQVVSNAARGSYAGDDCVSWWNTTFGSDVEAYFDITTVDPAGLSLAVYFLDANYNGYDIYYSWINGWVISRVLNGDDVTNTFFSATAPVASDSIGASYIDGVVRLYLKHSGTWTLLGSVNDSTYASSNFHIGLETYRAVTRVENFGGGSYGTIMQTSPDVTPPSTPSGLTIDDVSDSQVHFSWTPSNDDVAVLGYNVFRDSVQIGNTSDNRYLDSNLSPGTIYRYSVSAYDAAGNESAQSSQILAATPLPENRPPIIENIRVSGITSSSATITWTTDRLSDSTVRYGRTANYTRTVTDSTMTTNHSLTLVGLSSGTLYHFSVESSSATSSDMTFRTTWTSSWWWR